jgi:hypothetical protein
MQKFTDYFGQDIQTGDRVVVAIGAGRSGATLHETPVVEIVPLVPHRDRPNVYMRADQANKPNPTVYNKGRRRDDQMFVLKGESRSWRCDTKVKNYPNVENIVKVPA